jgi:hypothetical protein
MNFWWFVAFLGAVAVSTGVGRWIYWQRLSPREKWQRRYDSQMRKYFRTFK